MLARLIKQSSFARRLRAAARQEVEEAVRPLHKELKRLSEDVGRLHTAIDATVARAEASERRAALLEAAARFDDERRDALAALPQVLDEPRVLRHVRGAVAAARLHTDPCDHVVVSGLLPDDVYDLLVQAIPSPAFFDQRDPIKQNIPFPLASGPALTMRAWSFLDQVVAGRAIVPAMFEKFDQPLRAHYRTMFGDDAVDRAAALPRRGSGGRLMLRRPGYHLAPHRDPKYSFVTCLLYLARPGDDDAHGTQLFRVEGDAEADYKQTYYPEARGHRCELVATVPYRPNTMLAFVNARGAHGATIPETAPATLERYAYQFYVTPEPEVFASFIKQLPPERRRMWKSKGERGA
jgi:hypothetical protein